MDLHRRWSRWSPIPNDSPNSNQIIDCLIAACNAVGLSAHLIEQKMTTLSNELSGIVLPHDSSATHLDENGKTINNVKELENFKKVSKLPSEIWSAMNINSYQFNAKWVDPPDESKT